MTVLLFIIVFFLAVDQFSFTKILHRPLVACTLIGAVLGNAEQGVILGGTLEIMYAAYQTSATNTLIQNDGFVLYSVIAVIFTVVSDMTAVSAITTAFAFTALGSYLNYVLFDLNTVFLPMARKAAEKRNVRNLFTANILPMIITGTVYGLAAVLMYKSGDALYDSLTVFTDRFSWLFISLSYAGLMMPCIGFAVLLRNIGVTEVIGALFAGIAAGAVLSIAGLGSVSFIFAVMIAFAAGAYDYHNHLKTPSASGTAVETAKKNTIKGGAEKWW